MRSPTAIFAATVALAAPSALTPARAMDDFFGAIATAVITNEINDGVDRAYSGKQAGRERTKQTYDADAVYRDEKRKEERDREWSQQHAQELAEERKKSNGVPRKNIYAMQREKAQQKRGEGAALRGSVARPARRHIQHQRVSAPGSSGEEEPCDRVPYAAAGPPPPPTMCPELAGCGFDPVPALRVPVPGPGPGRCDGVDDGVGRVL